MTQRTGFLALTLALSLGGGCLVVADDPYDSHTGYLTLDVRLEGTRDPYLCSYYGVDALEVRVYDAYGYFVAEAQSACEAFGASVELYPGIYGTDVTLVDRYDRAVSVTQAIDGLRIIAGTDLVVDLNVPPGDFL